MNERITDSYVY